MTTLYNLSISAQATLNLHSLNNEGSEGNQMQTRMVTIADESGRLHTVNAISGDMLKHIQAEHLYAISRDRGLPLCAACSIFDANRMSADENFRAWLKKEKPTQIQILDRLLSCTLDDVEGNLITEGQSTPRKSVIEFGWAVGLPDVVSTEQFFHVKYDPDRREIPTKKEEREGNLGQAIFHRPTNSGQYALVCNLEAHRIGYNDINQKYAISESERQQRLAAVLESLLYTFIQPNGAMRNTQNPHIVAVKGVLSYSTASAPAPLISPLSSTFVEQTEQIGSSLNKIHANRLVVQRFDSLAGLADCMQQLIATCKPYTFTA